MLKKWSLILLAVFLSSCSSIGSYHYNSGKGSIKKGIDKYYVSSVKVDMPNSSAVDGYPSAKGLEEILSNSLHDALCKKNICALKNDRNKLDVDLQFTYNRRFSWFSNAYDSMHFSSLIEIKKGNELLATQKLSDHTVDRGSFRGFFSNLKKIFALSSSEDEKVELNILTNSIANDLKHLGKK